MLRAFVLLAGLVLASPCFATPPVVTPFSPPYGDDHISNRQSWVDETGNAMVYWSYGLNTGSEIDAHLIKASLTSATILTTGSDINIDGTTSNINIDYVPIGGYSGGDKLWILDEDWTSSSAVPAMFSFDRTSLDNVDIIDLTGVTCCTDEVKAITGDGSVYATVGGSGIFLFNTSSHLFASYVPGHTINKFVFDAANNLWTGDNSGNFWYYPVTTIGTPSLGAGVSVASGQANCCGGEMSYNPVTDTVISWTYAGSSLIKVVPINATTHVIGTAHTASWTPGLGFSDYGSAQMHQWSTSDFVGLNGLDGLGNNGIPGIYQISTGTSTYYNWAYWGRAEPDNFYISEFATAPDGSSVTGITGGFDVPDSGGDAFEAWMFTPGIAGSSCLHQLALIGVGC